jgi:hypothetical protein
MSFRVFILSICLTAVGSNLAQADTRYYALDAASLQTSTSTEVCSESGRTSYSSRTQCLAFDDGGGTSLGREKGSCGTDSHTGYRAKQDHFGAVALPTIYSVHIEK